MASSSFRMGVPCLSLLSFSSSSSLALRRSSLFLMAFCISPLSWSDKLQSWPLIQLFNRTESLTLVKSVLFHLKVKCDSVYFFPQQSFKLILNLTRPDASCSKADKC